MPNTLGAAIIAAANWTVATVGGIVAPNAFIAPFAVTSGTIAGLSATGVVGTTALTALALATMPSLPSPASSKVALRNPVGPRVRHYGRVRVSGELAELKVSTIVAGHEGDGVLFSDTMLMSGRIDGYEKFFIHDQEVRIDDLGRAKYPGVFNDNYRVSLYTHLGTASQTVDANLAAAFPARWTANHRLDGIAHIVAQFNGVPLEDFSTVYSFGIPSLSATFRGAKVWDPRDEDQDPDDPNTWAWTTNAALIILDYLRHDDGMRTPYDMIEPALDEWQEQADYCDEEVDLIGGDTEPRYQLAGSYALTDPRKDVLRRMLTPIDGRIRLREDFAIVLEVGRFETPTEAETFGLADIIAPRLKRGATKAELKNEIKFTYTSPGHNFQPQEGDSWRDEESIARDGLESAVLDLAWCPSHRQGRHRAKVEAERMNPEWSGQIVLGPRGFNLKGKRYIKLTIPFLSITDRTFFLTEPAKINILSGTTTCSVVSFAEEVYELEVADQGVSPENETPGTWGVAVPEGATGVTITADGAGGGGSGEDGGGGGARCIKTVTLTAADAGTIILFTVGAGGRGDPPDLGESTDGGDSTVTCAALSAGAIAMTAGGGQSGANGHAGGTASGGDTNTSGSSASGGDGGEAGSGATENEAPGGGGHEGADGGNGRVTFDWVF